MRGNHPTRMLAGDAVDVLVPRFTRRPVAVPRRLASVAPSPFERPGPRRALPVAALASAPEVALLVRFVLPFAATLDTGLLRRGLAEVRLPRAPLEALAAAVRVAVMDPAAGGLRRAAPDAPSRRDRKSMAPPARHGRATRHG